jgi:hypothetical protein
LSTIIWEGPSRFDGSPIFVALTWQTDNQKTGPMVQSWIQDLAEELDAWKVATEAALAAQEG